MPLFPVLFVGAVLWVLGELLEFRLTPEAAKASATSPAAMTQGAARPAAAPWQILALAVLLAGWGYGFRVFRNFFMADINHNIAIFFSKQGMWAKIPDFDAAAENLPEDMKKEYHKVGGALEHYELVMRLNPFFPMARYFIGNVHNDWGSSLYSRSLEADRRGDKEAAAALRQQAEETWRKALQAYDKVKAFAPNYVQTHHQVGLVYLKLGDMEKARNRQDKVKEYWDLALKNFELYQNLDPVFPQNYYRMAYIYYMRNEFDKAEAAYLGALKYNKENVVQRIFPDRNSETLVNLGQFNYVQWANKYSSVSPLPRDAEEFKKAESYYLSAVSEAEKAPQQTEQWKFAALKGLAILYSRANVADKATEYWNKVRALRPDDPDVVRIFSQTKN
jgi:tetratricopeptide (TPR) repeat protein